MTMHDPGPAAPAGASDAKPGLAYVVNSLNPGGTEKLVCEMGAAFQDEFALVVLCLDEPGTWAAALRVRGIPVYCLWRQPGLDLSIPGRLSGFFRRHDIRLVHAHQCTAWFYAALSRLWFRRPRVLLEEHGRFFPEVERPLRVLVNRMLIRRLSHRYVAVSEDIRQRLQRYEGIDAGRIRVIYNGVRPQAGLAADAREALRKALGFAPESFVVGTVGRFDPIKNLPMLVDAIACAGAQWPSVRGLLVGDGPEFTLVRTRIEQSGWRGRIVMTGFREDARALIACMDLFVLSSFSEGTSMALLEAMASGVPVAVTAVGGNPEVVVSGETGWVVPSGDAPALGAAIRAAAADDGLRRRLAEAGRRRFTECFSFDRMIEAYRSQYRAMLLPGG